MCIIYLVKCRICENLAGDPIPNWCIYKRAGQQCANLDKQQSLISSRECPTCMSRVGRGRPPDRSAWSLSPPRKKRKRDKCVML
jgi:hypothetical protein